MSTNVNDMRDRLLELTVKDNLSLTAISDLTGLAVGTIKDFLLGERDTSPDTVARLLPISKMTAQQVRAARLRKRADLIDGGGGQESLFSDYSH
jgi:hypothetical protein